MEDCASHVAVIAPVWPIVGGFATQGLDMVNGMNSVVLQIHLHDGTKERSPSWSKLAVGQLGHNRSLKTLEARHLPAVARAIWRVVFFVFTHFVY